MAVMILVVDAMRRSLCAFCSYSTLPVVAVDDDGRRRLDRGRRAAELAQVGAP